MYSLCFQNALYNYTKCATKFEQRFDPPLNNVKKTTLLEREGFPYQGSLSANKLWRAFVVCPRWKEKTNNNTVRGGYYQTCSRETGREGATMDPCLSFVYFYRTSKEDAILSEDLELPLVGEQATRVPSRLSTNGKRFSSDSLTSLSTDSWLVGKQTQIQWVSRIRVIFKTHLQIQQVFLIRLIERLLAGREDKN